MRGTWRRTCRRPSTRSEKNLEAWRARRPQITSRNSWPRDATHKMCGVKQPQPRCHYSKWWFLNCLFFTVCLVLSGLNINIYIYKNIKTLVHHPGSWELQVAEDHEANTTSICISFVYYMMYLDQQPLCVCAAVLTWAAVSDQTTVTPSPLIEMNEFV